MVDRAGFVLPCSVDEDSSVDHATCARDGGGMERGCTWVEVGAGWPRLELEEFEAPFGTNDLAIAMSDCWEEQQWQGLVPRSTQ